jgi:hypothetical protein
LDGNGARFDRLYGLRQDGVQERNDNSVGFHDVFEGDIVRDVNVLMMSSREHAEMCKNRLVWWFGLQYKSLDRISRLFL